MFWWVVDEQVDMLGFVGRGGCQRAWILIQYPIQRVLDSLGFSKFERSLFSVWTGAAPVWSVARPLHSGGCSGAEASPDRPLLSRLLFHPWLHVRFQSLSRHARNFRVASVWPELVSATASRGITNGALPAENARIMSARITVALPPLLPISFRVLARASQSAAQSLRSPLPCCPPAPHRWHAQAGKPCVRDRVGRARSLRRKLPRASFFRPFPGALSSAVPRALPAKHPEKSSARLWEKRQFRCRALPSRRRHRRRRAAARQRAFLALLQSSRGATRPVQPQPSEFRLLRPLHPETHGSSRQRPLARASAASARCASPSPAPRDGIHRQVGRPF